MKISVSYLKSNKSKRETIEEIEKTSADYIHVDLMDGVFVPTNNFEIEEVVSLLKDTKKPLDVHFMTKNLEEYISKISVLNPEIITFHVEAQANIDNIIDLIHQKGSKVGLSLKPDTKISDLIPYLSKIDYILIMSVEPGYGGQPFLESTYSKIEKLNSLKPFYHFQISVDGGVNDTNIEKLKTLNVDIVISGSYICCSDNYETKIQSLK